MEMSKTASGTTAARRCVSALVGRLLCWLSLHRWYETGRPGLGTLTLFRCSRCGITGNSHVTDDGEIFEDERIVGPDVLPTDDAGRWERGRSPWHADAFPEDYKDRAPEQGDRKTGWVEIDWCGNAIGWVPDGTVIRPNT